MRGEKRATNVVSSDYLAKNSVIGAGDVCAFFEHCVGCLGQRGGAALAAENAL
jgi:hypothetical protein